MSEKERSHKATWGEAKAMADAQKLFLRQLVDERKRQDEKWGQNIVDRDRMVVVLLEEVGEVARALLDGDVSNLSTELIQVGAVCSKFYEMIQATEGV